jgi:hypothetical protein
LPAPPLVASPITLLTVTCVSIAFLTTTTLAQDRNTAIRRPA